MTDTFDARQNVRETRRNILLDAAARLDAKAEEYRKEAERFRQLASDIQQITRDHEQS